MKLGFKILIGILIVVVVVGLVLLGREMYFALIRQIKTTKMYTKAKSRAECMGRKLVVVGDPHNGISSKFYNKSIGNMYECEDIMIDISPCTVCRANKKCRVIKDDMTKALRTLESDKYVIFVSCVLEYVDDIKDAISELYRVAGDHTNIFCINVPAGSLMSKYYPAFLVGHSGSKRIIHKSPPETEYFQYENL